MVWANALLERLSGAGILPPQRITVEVEIRDDVWVDIPRYCRDAIEVRSVEHPHIKYRFVEENGALRITDRLPMNALLEIVYWAKFREVFGVNDNLGINGYENLVDTWFRWKVEEQLSALSDECKYWGERFHEESRRIRAEASNRINKPQGRFLAGFR